MAFWRIGILPSIWRSLDKDSYRGRGFPEANGA